MPEKKLPTYRIGNTTYTVLFPDLLRPLTDEEYGELVESVKCFGIMQDIIVNGKYGVIEGGHRLRVASELGLDRIPHKVKAGLSSEKERDLALHLNERRRHLTADEMRERRKERIGEVKAAREAGKTTRAIASEQGVSQSQVRRDLERASEPGGSSARSKEESKEEEEAKPAKTEVERVTAPDGRSVPATAADVEAQQRKIRALVLADPERSVRSIADEIGCSFHTVKKEWEKIKEEAAAPKTDRRTAFDFGENTNGHAEKPEAPRPRLDALGHLVPAASLDAFASVEHFEALDGHVRQLQKGIDELSRLPGGEQLARCLQPTGSEEKKINKSEHLNALARDLRGTRPHSICPYCAGKAAKGCKGCSGTGWVTKTTWNGAEERLKERLAV